MCGEQLYVKCVSIQTLLSLLVGRNTPTEVFHRHLTKEKNQRREFHLTGSARLFCSTELSSQKKKQQPRKKRKSLPGATVLSCLFTRYILCQCYFRVFVVHFVFLGKTVRVYLCGDCLFKGYDWRGIRDMESRRTAHRVARRRSRGSLDVHAYCENLANK